MTLPPRVTVVEVGPRDGLQNEATPLTVEERVAFCIRLLEAGLKVVEVGAFVSPRWVPQMAGSDEVFRRVAPHAKARIPVLVPNRQGFERAREAGVREVAIFTAASETFNQKNINATIDESFARFAEFLPEARGEGMWVRGYLSTCFGCPYEGPVPRTKVLEVARRLLDIGCHEISIGPSRRGLPSWIARRAASGAAPTRRGPAATSPPRICSTCSGGWGSRPASTSRGWPPLRGLSPDASATPSPAATCRLARPRGSDEERGTVGRVRPSSAPPLLRQISRAARPLQRVASRANPR